MLKNKNITIYLFGYLFIWVVLTALFNNKYAIGGNAAENMAWANHLSVMYDKHPGLGAFLLKICSIITGDNPLLATVLSSGICVLVSLVYTYKISRLYFSKDESSLLVMATTFSAFYMLQYFIMYNQNTILLPFWVMASYYFLLIQNDNSYRNWILLSIVTALGVYAKFEILLLSGIMFLYFMCTFKKEYLPKILIAALVFAIAIIPAIIGIAQQNLTPILWIAKETNSSVHTDIITKLINGQLNNLLYLVYVAIPLVIVSIYIKIKRIGFDNYKFLSNMRHPLIVVCLYPLIFVLILQSVYGKLPDGWIIAIIALFLPALYKLFNLKLTKSINFKKLITILITIQLIIFSSYNLVKYFNDIIIEENTGNDIAVKADIFWGKYNDYPIPYVASSYYLTSFSKSKPTLLRDYTLSPENTEILVDRDGCNDADYKNIESSGFKILHHECTNISTVGKYTNQERQVSFFIVTR
jgi:hypothetical protein